MEYVLVGVAFWSCQLDDTPANATLALWESAGGVSVNSGNVIVQVIQKALSTPSAVAKVSIHSPKSHYL